MRPLAGDDDARATLHRSGPSRGGAGVTAALHFTASSSANARAALAELVARYGNLDPSEATAVVALGGDGFVLGTIHQGLGGNLPIFGMNRGSVGFLMNDYSPDRLPERVAAAIPTRLRPLRMIASSADGQSRSALAVNEVSLMRQTGQAAKIRITVDDVERITELICDGVLVATAAGSTAYNLSAHGPIIPIGSPLLALTPVSAFRPRRWRGALIPVESRIHFEVLEPHKRPVSSVADAAEVRDVREVVVTEDSDHEFTLLFDSRGDLRERMLREQFEH